jgi:hypothetical protein
MALEPWKGNSFLFDFVVIFIIVGAFGFAVTRVARNVFSPVLVIFAVILVATLWTVIGRRVQARTAVRKRWVQEIPGSRVDPDAPLKYSKEREAEWQRNQEAFSDASYKTAVRLSDEIEQQRLSRSEEVQRLERELERLKSTTIDSGDPISDDVTDEPANKPASTHSSSPKDIIL